MKKVEQLTEAQIAAMPGFVRSWVDRLDKGAPLDKEAATRGAKWLYGFCKLKDPLTIFVSFSFKGTVSGRYYQSANPLFCNDQSHTFESIELVKTDRVYEGDR